MATVECDGVILECGEWRTFPYSRIRVSKARKEYRCQRCGATARPAEWVIH